EAAVPADRGEELEGLAEPHVIGEDPAEARVPAGAEPATSLQLEGPHRRVHGRGELLGREIHGPDPVQQGAPAVGIGVDALEGGDLVPGREVVAAEPQPVLVGVRGRGLEEATQGTYPRRVEVEVQPVGEEETLPGAQRLDEGGKGYRPADHRDGA